MDNENKESLSRIQHYARMIQKQTGKSVKPYRADGFVNMMNKYGTARDTQTYYSFEREPNIDDATLVEFYEGNGLFAKIIDTPAEEALKHGFEFKDLTDDKITTFCEEALEELDWTETAMTAVKWARLFGGSIIILLINDGRGIEEPVDWKNIRSIDDMVVFDRSVVYPDYSSMYRYDPKDPFKVRGSRFGMPERYNVYSRYGNFTVHDSRCLVFKNGTLPERCTNENYHIWGMPEYVRLNKAIRDAQLAHECAPKMLDKSVQAIYKMKDLQTELATDEGEDRVLKRLAVIDMARGMLNSIAIDNEGEDYDFKTFQFSGVSDVIDSTCNFLSALTSIPQTILFGRSPAGMNATGDADFQNYYNYVEHIQARMLRTNLRYLLSIICQAGIATGEIEKMPKLKIEFSPLWSMSDAEKADVELKKAQRQQTNANTIKTYVDLQVISAYEVREQLAKPQELDVETMLDDYDEKELFPEGKPPYAGVQEEGDPGGGVTGGSIPGPKPTQPQKGAGNGKDTKEQSSQKPNQDPIKTPFIEGAEKKMGNSPDAAPEATKLPQDMKKAAKANGKAKNIKELELLPTDQANKIKDKTHEDENDAKSVGVVVVRDGRILCGYRKEKDGKNRLCGPGGHVEQGETPAYAAMRELNEEFNIIADDLFYVGKGPEEPNGLTPNIYLCTEFICEPMCDEQEMTSAQWLSLSEIEEIPEEKRFAPFYNGISKLLQFIRENSNKKIDNDNILEYNKDASEAYRRKVFALCHAYDLPLSKHATTREARRLLEQAGIDINESWENPDNKVAQVKSEHKDIVTEYISKRGRSTLSETIHRGNGETSISQFGENESCASFANKAALDDHFNRHGSAEPFPKKFSNKHEYEKAAEELLRQPCSGDIVGFAFVDTYVEDSFTDSLQKTDVMLVRYNRKTGEMAIGCPGKYIKTYYIPSSTNKKGVVIADYLKRSEKKLYNILDEKYETGRLYFESGE